MADARMNQSALAKAASTRDRPVTQQNVQQLLAGRNLTSKHLPAIARALGVNLMWLADGKGDKRPMGGPEAVLVGKVGAGAEIHRFDHPDVLAGVPLTMPEAVNVAEIEGDSQYPLQPGWWIIYGPENQGVPDSLLGKLCVVQVKDGPTLLKILKRGSRKGLYRLESWNAPPREDVRVLWAAAVVGIRPR
jgi:hypothetical protein